MTEILRSVVELRENESMSKHTTFKVGGPADIFVLPRNEDELRFVLKTCLEHSYPHFMLGNGSNLLVKDGGIRGLVVSLSRMNKIELLNEGKILAQAGVSLKELAEFALKHRVSGMEFTHGIPGSVGGGVFMNAGAYDSEMADIFVAAHCVDKNGEFVELDSDQMNFEYRKSAAQTQGLVIASVILQGLPSDKVDILAKMQDLEEKRSSKQPLEMASAGSTFKRPPGKFAGKLIMDAGLRGHQIGGAQVSEKHCGFVVNRGGATADDILGLIEHIRHTVKDKFGIWLETEVKIVGE